MFGLSHSLLRGIFRPSVDSGIGVGGNPKNTPFGLYRDGTELRGIYCSKTSAARSACKQTGPMACDFPSLIANDDYYGGLGGEFTISTKSVLSGTVVLRHELGLFRLIQAIILSLLEKNTIMVKFIPV